MFFEQSDFQEQSHCISGNYSTTTGSNDSISGVLFKLWSQPELCLLTTWCYLWTICDNIIYNKIKWKDCEINEERGVTACKNEKSRVILKFSFCVSEMTGKKRNSSWASLDWQEEALLFRPRWGSVPARTTTFKRKK